MRRSVFFLTPLIPLAVAACEDGPAQTFQPATGTLWNNGDTPAAVSDAGDPFNTTFGGTNKTQICSGNELQQQWGEMISQPLAPARFMAGIDLDDGPTFPLITVEKAETGPLFPVQFACVSQPPINPKNNQDGFYGAIPGAPPAATDPCLANATQDACLTMSNTQLKSTSAVCGWNVIPATTTYLQQTHAPTKLCQPTVLGAGGNGGDYGGSILVAWGNNQEFEMEWAIPTHKAIYTAINPGYTGLIEWNYLTPTNGLPAGDGKLHKYVYQVGHPVLKDGVSYHIAWFDNSTAGFSGQVDELYRGMASTYAPDIYDDAPVGVTCSATGTCLATNNAGDGTGRALFGMRPVSFYMFFDPPTLPDPSGFTVQSGYLFNIKYAPYSGIHSYFKMYDTTADNAEPFGDGLVGSLSPQSHCHFGMGDTFQNLITNCINVFPKPGPGQTDPNTTAQNKVLGDLAHDDQNFTFAVVGINQNFRPVKLDICLGPKPPAGQPGSNCGTDTQDVIHDTDSPLQDPDNNFANSFDSDVRSFGAILNDSYADPTSPPTAVNYKKDYHGSGAVWREFGRLVQTQMAAAYAAQNHTTPKALHDPSCFFPEQCSDGFSTTPGQCNSVAAACGECAGNTTQADCTGDTSPGSPCTWDATGNMGMGACYTSAASCAAASPGCTFTASKAGDPPSTATCSGGGWAQVNMMTLSPVTACKTSADCAALGALAGVTATCNTAAAGSATAIGLTPNTCTGPFDVNTWRPAPGCTGFETFITNAEPAAPATPDPNFPTAADDLWDAPGFFGSFASSFKPGTPYGLFCNDPGTYNFCGLDGDVQGLLNDLLDASETRLLQYLGNGNTLLLPTEGRDRRYFFKEWSLAYAKYLISPAVLNFGKRSGRGAKAGTTNPNCTDPQCGVQVGQFANQFIDSDNIIFDSIGGGASRSEFISFDFADTTHDPVDIEQRSIIIGTNLQSTDFFRKLDREERALFNALATDRTQASWGYLKDSTGKNLTDAYPAVPTTTCTADADCTKITSNWTCDTGAGSCVANFPRHNANPFLSNLTGSAALAAVGWLPAADANGALVPAPSTWYDPCNPVPPAGTTCAADSDCPGVMSCTGGACVQAKTAYFCATHLNDGDCANGGSQSPPTDPLSGALIVRENGKPLLEGYCGIFQANPFTLQSNAVTPKNTTGAAVGMQIVKTFPDLSEALVSLPTFPNPYAPDLTKNKNPVLVMVPWLPYQDGVGYPVSTNGSEDVFVNTAQLDFTGQVITPTLDFFPVPADGDPNPTNPTPPYGVAVQAWETQDFLGDVFLCVDAVSAANRPLPGSGAPGVGDILSAHMYSSAETLIDWISNHPGAQDSCGIIVRYSSYGNYPDFISSLTNGIRLSVEQGAGFGRIVDATVYAPGTGALAPP